MRHELDEAPGAWHLGAVDPGGRVVAVSLSIRLPASSAPPLGPPSQFMAVDPALQRQGIGSALMAEAFRRLEARDAVLLWAVARDSAVAFNERFGFRAVDQSAFVPTSTGRPHRVILLDLEARRPGNPSAVPMIDGEQTAHNR